MVEKQLIALLKKGDKDVLEDIYTNNKNAFIHFVKRYSVSNEEILDVYQDAVIALFENASKGNLDHIKCSIKTYLFSIGKNMIFKLLNNNNKTVLINTNIIDEDYNEPVIIFDDELTIYQIELQKGFRLLGNQCKKILTLFYYNGFTLDEITEKLEYTKKDVLKSQKSRCISKLKSILKVNG